MGHCSHRHYLCDCRVSDGGRRTFTESGLPWDAAPMGTVFVAAGLAMGEGELLQTVDSHGMLLLWALSLWMKG